MGADHRKDSGQNTVKGSRTPPSVFSSGHLGSAHVDASVLCALRLSVSTYPEVRGRAL